jgi:hypothetical protein
MKYFLVFMAGVFALAIVQALQAAPRVTMEDEDQKAHLEMYADAEGPPWHGIPIVGSINMRGWGLCMKPGVSLGQDEHGNSIFAEDYEVIWRCLQTHPTGEPIDPAEAPIVYCFVQNPALLQDQTKRHWACYHNYGDIFASYENQWGKSPLILPDEVEYVDTTEFK